MFLPTLVVCALIGLAYSSAEAAPFAKVRTVPAIVYDHQGNTGFSWVHTVDPSPILICFTEYPFPDVVDCHIATGEEYVGGVKQTISKKVAIIHPPKDI
jgi:hypothetical protein